MTQYDSDSSDAGDEIESNVLLGYASREETVDSFSQLGGRPTWLDGRTAPSATLAKCKTCNGVLSLYLQLHGDLLDRFPGHERRLYIFGCRQKPCRRKDASIRALRGVRVSKINDEKQVQKPVSTLRSRKSDQQQSSIGEALFGVKTPTSTQANPFSLTSRRNHSNPFAPLPESVDSTGSTLDLVADQPAQPAQQALEISRLAETMADKVRISDQSQSDDITPPPSEPWVDDSNPYPSYHLDADKEWLVAEPIDTPANARLDGEEGSSGSGADEKALFESSMDKTFQKFADRLAQNPEQVLRYEFGGGPLLYSNTDRVGKLLTPASASSGSKVQTSAATSGGFLSSRFPRCTNCGAPRVFELQLTPHAISELEVDELGIDGMDWGTIIVAVCSEDCAATDAMSNSLGYVEEWVGVQYEEIAGNARR